MNELTTTTEPEFIWRRLGEAFPLSGADDSVYLLIAAVVGLVACAVGSFVASVFTRARGGLAMVFFGGVPLLTAVPLAMRYVLDIRSEAIWIVSAAAGGVLLLGTFIASAWPLLFGGSNSRAAGRSDSIVFWVTASIRAAIFLLPAILLLVGKFGTLPVPKPLWQTLTVGTFLLATALTVLSYLRDSQNHFGWWSLSFGGALLLVGAAAIGPILLVCDQFPLAFSKVGFPATLDGWTWLGVIGWWMVPAAMILLGTFVAVSGRLREPMNTALAWTPLLAMLRIGAYGVLSIAFLLPATQEKDKTRKQSRVLILIDISPSVSPPPGESAKRGWEPGKTRLEKILDFLTDANAVQPDGSDKANFMKGLLDKNPVFAYRFGKQLDDDAQQFAPKSTPWTQDEWTAWTKYDFRPVALRGLSEETRRKAQAMPAWKADEPGNADWAATWAKAADAEAIPDSLPPAEMTALLANRTKLMTRVDAARSVVTGTDVPNSLADLLRREGSNKVMGVVLFSDGRNNPGVAGSPSIVRELATKEKIPIFTVAVGEVRENVAIDITELQAPSATGPDEPVAVTVAVDGIGLPGQETDVFLDLFLPGQDPKKDTPAHTLSRKIKFLPGDPPRAEVEFRLDPDDKSLPEVLTEPSKKEGRIRQFKLSVGKENWKLVARVPADKREIFDGKEHVTPPREVLVQDRILRVLMVASAPSREYQTLRTLLVREENQGRARVCVLIQNEGGLKGDIVQDVEPNQVLTKFPDRLDLTNKVRSDDPSDRFYNLNEYDLVIMFDPDWEEKSTDGTSRISDQSIKNLANWVDNLGGGLMYVAAPLYTYKLARTDESSPLRPLVDVLPVEIDDIVKRGPRQTTEPRRLLLTPTPLANLLRLEEDILKDSTDPTYQVAGWEKFFTGQDRFIPTKSAAVDFKPTRGFFADYPVRAKRGASILAEFVALNEKSEAVKTPYLVITQPARGRSAFIGSGEMYRLRQIDPAFYDRFWIKMSRFLVANREAKASRGRVFMSKEFVSGAPVRVQARILAPNAQPYPAEGASGINAKFRIEQLKPNGEKIKDVGTFPLAPRKGAAGEFDGRYNGQTTADPTTMPDEFLYRVVVDVPDSGEPLTETFRIRRSDPELDNLRPDFEAMRALAGTLDEVAPLLANDPKTLLTLRGVATDNSKAKLAFKLDEVEKLKLIPKCIDARTDITTLRGKVDDLWDNEIEPPAAAEASVEFFRTELFGGRLGRWGNVLAMLTLLLGIGTAVGSIRSKVLTPVAYLLFAATAVLVYLGNSFALGELTQPLRELFSVNSVVAPFQQNAVGGLQFGTVLSLGLLAVSALAGFGCIWVGKLKWVAGIAFVLALLAIAPVALFADTRLPTAPDDAYTVVIRYGLLLVLPLALISIGCFVISSLGGGLKWTGLAFLLFGAAAVYLTYPFPVGVVIAVAVTLLSFEWMTRKLMRLA